MIMNLEGSYLHCPAEKCVSCGKVVDSIIVLRNHTNKDARVVVPGVVSGA
jgi:hypothetical protein